jgi:hypothetical protein
MGLQRVIEADKASFMQFTEEEIARVRIAGAAQALKRDREAAASRADGMEWVLHAIRDWMVMPDGWEPPTGEKAADAGDPA